MPLLTSALCSKDDNTNAAKSLSCENLINDPLDESDSTYLIPVNAFTPDNDGLNDRFWIYYANIKTFKLTVYDEQSNAVFYTEKITEQWDPNSPSVTGHTYFYRIEAISTTDKRIGMCGEVHPLSCIPSDSNNKYYFQSQFNGYFFDLIIPSGEYNVCP